MNRRRRENAFVTNGGSAHPFVSRGRNRCATRAAQKGAVLGKVKRSTEPPPACSCPRSNGAQRREERFEIFVAEFTRPADDAVRRNVSEDIRVAACSEDLLRLELTVRPQQPGSDAHVLPGLIEPVAIGGLKID